MFSDTRHSRTLVRQISVSTNFNRNSKQDKSRTKDMFKYHFTKFCRQHSPISCLRNYLKRQCQVELLRITWTHSRIMTRENLSSLYFRKKLQEKSFSSNGGNKADNYTESSANSSSEDEFLNDKFISSHYMHIHANNTIILNQWSSLTRQSLP